jgi:ABC-type multidrug transport system fused ATPase/permease subunit
MLRQRPQPQEGSIACIPDWPPSAWGTSQQGSGSGSSSSSSRTPGSSGNGSGPHTQQLPFDEQVDGSRPSQGQQSGAGGQRSTGALLLGNSFPMQSVSQPHSSGGTVTDSRQPGLHLEFRNVSFSYSQSAGAGSAHVGSVWGSVDFSAVTPAITAAPAADQPMQLQGISFTLRPGEALGIVGPPGELRDAVLQLLSTRHQSHT